MSTLITVLHVIVCLFLMLTVLLQDGKSGMGGAFGGGNAATVFGGSGASSFLRKLTAGAATVFMLTSIVLAWMSSHNSADSLEKFGENQAKLAAEKEAAKAKALQEGGAGSGSASSSGSAGAGSAMSPITITPNQPGVTVTPGPVTPATPGAGSGSAAAGSAAAGSAGSASPSMTPAEKPLPPPASMGEPKPAGTGSASPAGTKAATSPSSAPAAGSAAATPAVIEKKPVTGTAAPVNPQPSPAKAPQTSDNPSAPR